MNEYRELLIGAGSRHVKDLRPENHDEWENLTTLDNNPDHKPDIIHDLKAHRMPFEDNTFDEIHAYEVLEHLAQQGDYKFFFREFSEYWRILKPGGVFLASVPSANSVWAWGDPSHTRVITRENLTFLLQKQYEEQVGKTSMSDFRNIYKADFSIEYAQDRQDTFAFVLKAIK